MTDDNSGFLARFTVLRGAIRELWLIFGAKLLTIAAYGVMNLTLVLWLSSDLGYGDVSAGTIVTVWSTIMTVTTVLVGSLVDAVGVRRALLLGIGICLVARGVMTFSTGSATALGLGLMPLAAGEALLTPVMVAATRRFSTVRQRSMAFSIFYALMNAGFAVANYIFDYVRAGLGAGGAFRFAGIELSPYRTLFLISFLLTIPNLILVYFFLREGAEATEQGLWIEPLPARNAGIGLAASLWGKMGETFRRTVEIFAGLWRQPAFYKFLVFLSLVVAVRLIFYQMYYTYPKFGVRELGVTAPIGRLWAVNSISVLFLVPVVGALFQKASSYRLVQAGSLVSAASVFIMALPTRWFEPLAGGWFGWFIGRWWLGLEGPIHPYYVMIPLYVGMLSIGEALWSPRLYEYTAAIAPKGQEGSYMSLSFLPYFVAKFFVGMLSGVLLAKFCPEQGPRDSQTMWLIIALITTITPVGLFVLGPYIRVKEAGRED